MSTCNCGFYPTVIIPGIGQSKVDLYSLEGKKIKNVWPLSVDEKAVLKRLAPKVAGLFLGMDKAFCESLKAVISDIISPLRLNVDGVPVNKLCPVDYNGGSVGECTEDEKRYIYNMVPIKPLGEIIGEDHMFFFSYNSFGQPYETAKALHEYIQNVKEKTGHDKVNIVPVSLGATITTAYLDMYGNRGDIHRICYFVPAANGSTLIADVFDDNVNYSCADSIFELLLGPSSAKTLSSFLGRVPPESRENILRAVIDTVRDKLLLNCPGMWATVPKERFESIAEKHLSKGAQSMLRAKAFRYYRAQCRLNELLEQQKAMGVKIFDVCGYGEKLLSFSENSKINSDTIVDFSSASLGGTSAFIGEKLESAAGEYVSADKQVDLSTAICPDTTFCFKHQIHDYAGFNDVAISLCAKILTDEAFTDIHSSESYPQFNGSRNTHNLKYCMLPQAYELLEKNLPAHVRAELDDAVLLAQNLFGKTLIDDFDEADRVIVRLGAAINAAKHMSVK